MDLENELIGFLRHRTFQTWPPYICWYIFLVRMQKFRIRAHGVTAWILCSISCRNPTKKDTLNWRMANILNALSHTTHIYHILNAIRFDITSIYYTSCKPKNNKEKLCHSITHPNDTENCALAADVPSHPFSYHILYKNVTVTHIRHYPYQHTLSRRTRTYHQYVYRCTQTKCV